MLSFSIVDQTDVFRAILKHIYVAKKHLKLPAQRANHGDYMTQNLVGCTNKSNEQKKFNMFGPIRKKTRWLMPILIVIHVASVNK